MSINVRLISNNDDYEDYGHRMNLWIERDFLSEAKRNGKAFPHIFRFTVTRRKNNREFVGVVRVEERIHATLYELIETFAGINFAKGCGDAVARSVTSAEWE